MKPQLSKSSSGFLYSINRRRGMHSAVIGLVALPLMMGQHVLSNPSGGNVASGKANISANGSTLNVNQLSDKAIINWNDFSIASGETTRFIQPSATSAVLNRVVGGDISKIYGNLKANGQVYLINGNGIMIGKSGVIDTAGFLATTHSIKDSDFLNGGDMVLEPGKHATGASIVNLGKISATGGDIFLIADYVTNEGSITASNGHVGIAAARGARVLLAESGDQRILIQASKSAKTDKNGVVNKGSIKAINAEIKAAGGNIYALAINNNGVVRATGIQKKGGRILLTSKGGKIKLGKKSHIRATGKRGGGKINIGGNKAGKGKIAVAKQVNIEKGSKINADAIKSGKGGTIVVFAEGNTSIAGSFSAKGGAEYGDGGFIETSGKQNLLVAENTIINTSAANGASGTWLLDPTDFTISAGNAAQTSSGIGADTLVTNLGTSSVTIQTANSGFDAGHILVNGEVKWAGANSLTLMAINDVRFNANVQHDGTGDLNIIGGWDGTTAFDVATFDAVDVTAAPSLYGNSGIVWVGLGTQTTGVAVGSRHGTTRVYGRDLLIIAGTGGDGRYAQLGFQASNKGSGYSITGDLNARVLGSILAKGGSANRFNYAQLGHVGADQTSNSTIESAVMADITVAAGKDLLFSGGGANNAFSQLGHGGGYADGNHSGAITLSAVNDLSFSGGGGTGASSRLGHGGVSADGNHSGAITLRAVNDLSFSGGGGVGASSQLGHGGLSADGNHSGAITLSSANDLSFSGGAGVFASSQLGHGGNVASGNHSGTITLSKVNDLSFSGGGGREAYNQLGHGGIQASGNHSGAITLSAANDLNFSGGAGELTFSHLGHGGFAANGNHSGAITLSAANDLSFSGGGEAAYSQLGHGGRVALGNHSGTITLSNVNNLSFSGGAEAAYSQLGHGGYEFTAGQFTTGTRQGDITITSSGELSLANGTSGNNDKWIIGHTTMGAVSNANILLTGQTIDYVTGDAQGTDAVINTDFANHMARNLQGGNVTLRITGVNGNDGQLNYQAATNYESTNNYNLMSTKNIVFTNKVQNSSATTGGELNIIAGWDGTTAFNATSFDAVDVNATASLYGKNNGIISIGDGSQTTGVAVGSRNGTTRTYGHNLNILAGTGGDGRYAQLGFQASDKGSSYSITGDLNARVLGTILAKAGSANAFNYAQLGHVGADQTIASIIESAVMADITVAAGKDLTFEGGTGVVANYSQLGHGGYNAYGNHSGSITLSRANDLSFSGGGGNNGSSQLGHGGLGASGNHSGAITLSAVNDLSFTGGAGRFSFSQLGHGGVSADGSHSGAITLSVANDLSFSGGGGNGASSQLGHGGFTVLGNHSGTITLSKVNDLSFSGGAGSEAYSQLGHGGFQAGGNHSGNITLSNVNNLNSSGGTGINAYSQLGHGGIGASGNHSGTITLSAVNDLNFSGGGSGAYSQLGHGGYEFTAGQFTTGTRQGDITITSTGELSLANGASGANDKWIIGHATSTANGVSNANILFTVQTVDNVIGDAQGTDALINTDFANHMARNLMGGNVTLNITGVNGNDGNVNIDSNLGYNSANHLTITSTKNLSLTANGAINNAGTGEVILSTQVFANNGAANNITTTGGQTLIYSNDWDNDTRGTLAGSKNLYNRSFTANGPSTTEFTTGSHNSGDFYIYKRQPVLTVTANNSTQVYNGTVFSPSATVTGSLVNGDTAMEAYSGNVTFSGSSKNVGTHSLTPSAGSLASDIGYGFNFVKGTLKITPATLSLTGVTAQNKVYNANTIAGLSNGSLSGIIAGDTVNLTQGSGAFADKNVGIGKTVTATGFVLTGTDAGNYTLAQPTSLSADITPATLTITGVNAQNKIFDGNTTAILTNGSLSGILTGDTVNLTQGSGAFADSNVDAGKVVTASGFSITGANAKNYVVSQPTSLRANITPSIVLSDVIFQLWKDFGVPPVAINNQGGVNGRLKELRKLLDLEDQAKKGIRSMSKDERKRLADLLRLFTKSP